MKQAGRKMVHVRGKDDQQDKKPIKLTPSLT
jgi:hypothetical protein